jgi:hypothetical protein
MKFLCAILVFMSIVLQTGSSLADASFKARVVTGSQVMKMLYTFNAPASEIRDFPEISEAIAIASTHDPILPNIEEGSEITAAMLVALAWHESRFRRSAVGDQGRSFGLYQIQPGVHKVNSNLLTLPRTASAIAIGLMKASVEWCLSHGRPWREALAWYAASSDAGAKHPKIVAQSVERMETMAKVYLVAFGKPANDTTTVGNLLVARSR